MALPIASVSKVLANEALDYSYDALSGRLGISWRPQGCGLESARMGTNGGRGGAFQRKGRSYYVHNAQDAVCADEGRPAAGRGAPCTPRHCLAPINSAYWTSEGYCPAHVVCRACNNPPLVPKALREDT